MTTSAPIHAGDLELWVERRGDGPDVLLIAGLGDPPRHGSHSSKGSPTATA